MPNFRTFGVSLHTEGDAHMISRLDIIRDRHNEDKQNNPSVSRVLRYALYEWAERHGNEVVVPEILREGDLRLLGALNDAQRASEIKLDQITQMIAALRDGLHSGGLSLVGTDSNGEVYEVEMDDEFLTNIRESMIRGGSGEV